MRITGARGRKAATREAKRLREAKEASAVVAKAAQAGKLRSRRLAASIHSHGGMSAGLHSAGWVRPADGERDPLRHKSKGGGGVAMGGAGRSRSGVVPRMAEGMVSGSNVDVTAAGEEQSPMRNDTLQAV